MVPKHIGRYEIISELGRGGMATVYLAHDPNFDRNVAVKVLPREYLHDPQFRARFEREAQTIAQLEHPAIVPVYDYGETEPDPVSGAGGQPYIVMRLMPGGSLADHLRSGPLPVAEAARLITRLARALDKAHDKGIIHRDLKPANILFDEDRHPYISDFGIAKILQSAGTLSGTVLGRPAYMSPEQARGERDIDGRSDLYTLGAILFETLTGKLPYESDTPMGQAVKHITEPVPRILTANPNLPPACESVIERAMAKDRADRYASARDMAAALDAIVKGQSPTEQITGALPVKVPATVGPTQPGVSPTESRHATPPPRRQPTMAWGLLIGAGLTLTLLVGVLTAGGLALVVAFRPTSTLTPTATHTATPSPPSTPTASATVAPSSTSAPTSVPSSTPEVAATLAPSPTVFLRPLTSINASKIIALKTLGGHTRAVTSVAFSPDGQLLASGSYDKTARVWYVGDGSPVRAVERHQYTVFSVAYSPDGQTLLVGGNDGFVSLWDAATGAFQNEWRVPSALSMVFSPDNALLAIGTGNGTVRIYRWLDQQLIRVLEGHTTNVWSVAWSPDGQFIASASDDSTVRVWKVDDGTEVLSLAHPEGVLSVTFSPSGDSIISGCRDADIRVWRTADGELLRTLETHTSWIGSLAFSEDGSILASGSYDGTIGLWRWVDGSLIRQLTQGAGVLAIAFSPDGSLLASGARDNTVLIWGVGE